MRKIYCFGKSKFEKYVKENKLNPVPEDYAVISIENPYGENHTLESADNVLNLDFHDILRYTETYNNTILHGLSDEQADEIFEFIEKHKDKNFLVHCGAGLSRSQAITKIIAKYYDFLGIEYKLNPENHDWTHANPHVYSLLNHIMVGKYYGSI